MLRTAKCEFGIVFSKNGISGEGRDKYAERELLKIKHDGVTILSVSEIDLKEVSLGTNFFSMLRDSYERERLDLPKPKLKKGPRKKSKRTT
jgi:hypothetical protein